MRTSDILRETYTALSANKVRTVLTMLGIVIGIGSVIVMVGIGQGASSTITSRIQSLGSNLILVTPGGTSQGQGYQVRASRGSQKTLTEDDAEAVITDLSDSLVAPELSGRYQVVAKGTNTNTTVTGVTGNYATVRNITMSEGDFISDENSKQLANVAVLGPTTASDLFDTDDPIGKQIRINGQIFTVIGLTQSKGSNGFGSQDDMIFVPLSVAQKFLAGSSYVSTISIQAPDANSMSEVQDEVTNLLLQRHNITDSTKADFSTTNQTDIASTASSITGTLTLLLGSIAGISLLVGGIGIMNMMLTTVTERTREIGLRKAIGAKKADISKQFLFESIILTFGGGIIGFGMGWLIASVLTWLGVITAVVTFSSVMLAFGVSAFIGIVFGYYPARHAASLNPIDALRYE